MEFFNKCSPWKINRGYQRFCVLNCKDSKGYTWSSNKQSGLSIGLQPPTSSLLYQSVCTLWARRPLLIHTLLLVNLLWGNKSSLTPFKCQTGATVNKTQCDIVPSLEAIQAEARQSICFCTTIEMWRCVTAETIITMYEEKRLRIEHK